jgi:type II secretory pathway predicted ATPase ExeA
MPYFPGAAQEEALARMHFVLEQGSACGLLLGPAGSGKTLLLARFADAARRRGVATALLSGWTDRHGVLFDLSAQWGLNPAADADVRQLWRLVADRLAEYRYQQTAALLLVDDVEQSGEDACFSLLGLLACAEAQHVPLALVAAAARERLPTVDRRLLARIDLRIELEPWNQEETAAFVADALVKKGGKPDAFDAAAVEQLYRLSGGLARKIGQLAELSLLAGAGQGRTVISGELVKEACAELGVAASGC